jgi:hypothetical protein
MRLPRVRFTIRRMMVAVAIVAVVMTMGSVARKSFGPRNGGYRGVYRYLGNDWRWHEVRGNIIFVEDGMIFVD